MKKSHNHLTYGEMHSLCEEIKSLREMESSPLPFDNWKQAIKHFESVIDHEITQPNIETAAGICKVSLAQIVSAGESEHPFARMMAKVEKLESRLEKLESLVGGI